MGKLQYEILKLSICAVSLIIDLSVASCSPLDDVLNQLDSSKPPERVIERNIESRPSKLHDIIRPLVADLLWDPSKPNSGQRDALYSPHLRDITSGLQRSAHVHVRSQAGELSGIREDACPNEKSWSHAEHETTACCGVDTSRYAALREDHNFKACCVRRGEEQLSEEEIACRHPDGSGWAGLFEFYFPTQIMEWGRTDGRSLLIEEDGVAVGGGEGKSLGSPASSLSAGDITLRVNLPAMALKHREELARDLCMHPKQLMKLMDPDPVEDPYQRKPPGQGTAGEKMLEAIPVWTTQVRFGVLLVSDPLETLKLLNFDAPSYPLVGGKQERATDLALGYEQGFIRNARYCDVMAEQKQHADSDGLREAVQVYGKGLSREAQETNTGYSCREAGGGRISLSPLARIALKDGPEVAALRALAFAVAAGVYAPAMADSQSRTSYYKRFEPQPYFRFSGKPFIGGAGSNEHGVQCRSVRGETYAKDRPQADRLYSIPSAIGGSYAAPMRIFASCPKGWIRWRGVHSESACGEEKLW